MIYLTRFKIVVVLVFALVCENSMALCSAFPYYPDTTKQIEFHFQAVDPGLEREFLSKPELFKTQDTKTGLFRWLPLFAVKTNLLFDAVSALNIELEVPVGNRWSVAGEWIFPWWLWKRKQVCLQVLSGNAEGRYWFGDRSDKRQLTGWFAGVYVGGGLYDLEWKSKGYQGEFFIAAGVSGGFAHTVNRSGSLRMEYSLGIGYMQTQYREYIPVSGGKILSWQRDGRYSWFGPTRAKVSLVWMINNKGSRK